MSRNSEHWCAQCWPEQRRQLGNDHARSLQRRLADLRAAGADPSQAPDAAARRSASLSRRKKEQLAWDTQSTGPRSGLSYEHEVQPHLVGVPLSHLQAATGLSKSACSRIRSGTLTPHRRHWEALATLVDSTL